MSFSKTLSLLSVSLLFACTTATDTDSEDTKTEDSEETGDTDTDTTTTSYVDTAIGISLTYFSVTLKDDMPVGGILGSAIFGTWEGAYGCYALGETTPVAQPALTPCTYCDYEFMFTVENTAPFPGYDETCDYFPETMLNYWEGFNGGLGWGPTGYVDVVWPGSGETYSLGDPVFLYYNGNGYTGWYPFAYGYNGNGWNPNITADYVVGMSFWNYYAYYYVVE